MESDECLDVAEEKRSTWPPQFEGVKHPATYAFESPQLGPPVVPFLSLLLGEGSPTKKRLQKKVGTLILTSLLEDLDYAFESPQLRGLFFVF